jgi:hypothetical protein
MNGGPYVCVGRGGGGQGKDLDKHLTPVQRAETLAFVSMLQVFYI